MAPDAESSGSGSGSGTGVLTDPLVVREWLAAPYHSKQLALLDKFEIELRLGRLSSTSSGSSNDRRAVTARTVELLKIMIGGTRWKTPAELIALLRGLGRELHSAGGVREPAIGNVVRRIIAAVREEVMTGGTALVNEGSASTSASSPGAKPTSSVRAKQYDRSLESMLWALPQHVKQPNTRNQSNASTSNSNSNSTLRRGQSHQRSESVGGDAIEPLEDLPPPFYQVRPDLKIAVMEAIQEITSDLEDLHKNINDQATNHIHAGEVILTYGRSQTVEMFFKAAADKKLRFTVVVCEAAPHMEGHEMARSLAQAGIECVCIPDSAIAAMMARVNKVILPAHAVLANGGLIGPSGSNLVVLSASHNSVPVVCLTGIFKLTPLFPHDGQDTLNDLLSPAAVVDYATSTKLGSVDFLNPMHDYIRPEWISLYVTNVGSFQPSYIYRLLAEYYHSDDWEPFQ